MLHVYTCISMYPESSTYLLVWSPEQATRTLHRASHAHSLPHGYCRQAVPNHQLFLACLGLGGGSDYLAAVGLEALGNPLLAKNSQHSGLEMRSGDRVAELLSSSVMGSSQWGMKWSRLRLLALRSPRGKRQDPWVPWQRAAEGHGLPKSRGRSCQLSVSWPTAKILGTMVLCGPSSVEEGR